MQELLAKTSVQAKTLEFKGVILYIQSQQYQLSGTWQWDLHTDAVFCSDVMFGLPAGFNGTKGLIHPEDLPGLKASLASSSHTFDLVFRIITTYGEVKQLSGHRITLLTEEATWITPPERELLAHEKWLWNLQKENEQLRLNKEIWENAERLHQTGSWYFNSTNSSGWYSDQVFRIFGLPPQSLNAHLNTFASFIHPDDKPIVTEALDKAYREQIPLHLHYRILTAKRESKKVHQILSWHHSSKGDRILSGIIREETEAFELDQRMEQLEQDLDLQKQMVLLDEHSFLKGHWSVNLVTRKTVFSDTCYRMFGVKQKTPTAGINTFINYIHSDDQERVMEAYRQMLKEQVLPDLEFRIVRNEGRLRYVKQTGKTVNHGGDPMIIGLLQDISAQKQAEIKLKELKETLLVRGVAASRLEQLSNSGSWIWDLPTGRIIWSEGLYSMLGYKQGSEELTQKHLLSLIHREDREKFSGELTEALKQKSETALEFRLLKQGSIRYMKASFSPLTWEGRDYIIGTLQDISSEKNMQQQLQQRIQLAESIAENLLDRAILTDNNNTIVIWNKACEKMYKIKKEETVGRNIFEVFPQLKTPEDLARFQSALGGEEIRLMHQKSNIINEYHNLCMVPLKDENENVWGILHLLQDVTKEHELQRHLNERLNFIESLVEASVDRIIVMDPDMNYILWNKRCEDYYGLKKEEIIGKNILEVFPGAIHKTSYHSFKKALRGETVFIRAGENGEADQPPEEIYLVPIKNEKAEVTAVLWILHDLTKDLELDRQKNKAFEILNALNENYFELDRQYRFSFVNQKGQEFFQIPEEAMLGKTFLSIFPYAAESPVYQAITFAMEERVPVRGEYYSHVRNIPILVSIAPTCDGVAVAFFDIRFIKDAQQQLAEEHERLKEAQSLGHIGSFEWDMKANQMIWNEELYKICCVSSDEVITFERAFEFYSPETRDTLIDLFAKAIQTGEPFELEEKFVRTDGELRYVFMRAGIVKNEEGQVQKLRGIVQDITERKLLEAKTKENEHFLRQIEEATPDAIAVFDYETNETIYLNQAFAAMTGYTSDEFNEMGFAGRMKVMINAEEAEKIYDLHRHMLSASDEDIVTIQYMVYRKDGSECQIKSRSKVFKRNGDGQPTRILSVLQDVTQEVELNKALLERAQFIEALADNSVNAILVLNKDLRMITWNRRCEESFHISKKEVAGRHFLDLFPKLKNDAVVMDALHRSLAGEYVHIPQRKNIYTSGYSELFYVPLKDADGLLYGILHVSHDISQRVAIEEELKELNKTLEKKNKELEEKHEEISQFAFVASHDLKEPLRKIHTFSDFLLQKEDLLSSTNKAFLNKINAAVKRMDLLIEDILVLTKINSEKKLERNVDLNKVLKNIKAEMKEQLDATGAVVQSQDLPVIKGNENQLFYLFKNLISNAVKFQPHGNRPEVRINVHIVGGKDLPHDKLEAEKDYYKICFEDNGLGFDPKYSKKIFGIFQRLHGKLEFEGTGMGLAICKKIIENHNGFIEAFSTPGKGSVFCCYFEVK